MASSLFPATRWSLVDRLDEGRGVARLLDYYADAVARYLGLKFPDLRRRGQIDDLVQEVLLALLRQGEVLQRADPAHGGRFRYFLMRVAYNAARNAHRRLARADWSLLADEAVSESLAETGTFDGEADMDRAWAASVLQQAWRELRAWAADGRLPSESVALLERNLLHGVSLREAATELGLSLGTAHRRLARARTLVRQAVIDHLRFTGALGDDDEEQAFELLLAAVRE